ncbi:nuclear matrix constituent protein 1a-like [Zingiber officinale]|uniref:nuclear matrix constituent protein 1a-like n=1 Tax=Zingiber officinale TaxID=94328 RepID=UPI001C4CC653|nr:nuclear matrix constituent protein 1a-like [Zingiber officinale]XP_042451738.1 nuclear matrix constituent protein 1a-like [Zingiber officinale]
MFTSNRKGKNVVDTPPPPQASLGANGGVAVGGGEDLEVWRHFREAGFLDEAVLQRKDRDALAQRIAELEKELHEYQYNMGLLLIEKKSSITKYEEVRQTLSEAEEILKREQTAHMIIISEYEKREEKWQKDLGIEKQKVADLEKDLQDIRFQMAEIKFTSEKKLADSQALETGLEEHYLEIEAKAHAADAKLAEVNRKSSEIDRKLDDLEGLKRKLQKENLSLSSERKAHEKNLIEQREHFLGWEKMLRDSQKRLDDGQKLLNERENRANEVDRMLKRKQTEIEDAEKQIEASKKSLKLVKDDISTRLSSLECKEKEAEIKFESLEKKERELASREEKLNARENVEIQKLLDEHNALLDSKKQEFELEMKGRQKALDEEIKVKVFELEEKKKEIDLKEQQITKKEHLLQKEELKLKEMEKDHDSKSLVLRKWEESIKVSEKELEKQKQQLESDRQELLKSISELETMKDSIEAKKAQIVIDEEHLKLTRQEREEHTLHQSKLKQEIEDYRMIKSSLDSDREDLRRQREKFEEEWELLDNKQLALELEIKRVNEEKERFEKWRYSEEERFRNGTQAERISMEEKLDNLETKKELFEKTIEHEKSAVHDMLELERADMARDLELRRHELEMEIGKRKEALEKDLQDRESEFERKKSIELNEIQSLSGTNELTYKRLEVDKERLEREKEDLVACRKKLENDQLEIHKDIETLRELSREMKDQRKKFLKDREHFLAMVEEFKKCKNCGVQMHDLELLSLKDTEVVRLPRLTFNDDMKPKDSETTPQQMLSASLPSGSRLTLLQKCSRLFNFSPKKKEDMEDQEKSSTSLGAKLDSEVLEGGAYDEAAPSQRISIQPFHNHRSKSGSGIWENRGAKSFDGDRNEPDPSFGDEDNLADANCTQANNADKEVVAEQVVQFKNHYEKVGFIVMENDSQPERAKEKTHKAVQSSKPRKIRRTRTVKKVVEEAQAFLRETSTEQNEHSNGQGYQSSDIQVNGYDVVHAGQKRDISHVSLTSDQALDSETCSENVSLVGRRKKRQIAAPQAQTLGEKRYNFRRSTIAAAMSPVQPVSDQKKGLKIRGYQQPSGDETLKRDGDEEGTSQLRLYAEPAISFVDEGAKSVEVEISQKLVQHESEFRDHYDGKSIESSEQVGDDTLNVNEITVSEPEPNTPTGGSVDGDGEKDEEDLHNHDVSIGKKLWTFFTT